MIWDWREYDFSRESAVLVDTNIWLKAFPNIADPSKDNPHANFIAKLVSSGAEIILDVLVTGEFMSAFVRREMTRYNQLRQRNGEKGWNYKEFRKTSFYADAVADAACQLDQIMECPNLRQADNRFSNTDLKGVVEMWSTGGMDWNDLMLGESCKREKWLVATDDSDFANIGVDIVTDNPLLIGSSE